MASHSQQDLDVFAQEIGVALIKLLPQDWRSALLTLKVAEKGLGGGLAHNIRSAEGKTDVVIPDADLMLITRRFELYCRDHNVNFVKTTVKVWEDRADWEVDLIFDYGDKLPEKKSRWKR